MSLHYRLELLCCLPFLLVACENIGTLSDVDLGGGFAFSEFENSSGEGRIIFCSGNVNDESLCTSGILVVPHPESHDIFSVTKFRYNPVSIIAQTVSNENEIEYWHIDKVASMKNSDVTPALLRQHTKGPFSEREMKDYLTEIKSDLSFDW